MGEKRRLRAYRARVKALPSSYRTAVEGTVRAVVGAERSLRHIGRNRAAVHRRRGWAPA